jgi:hypothetical protein
MIVGNPTEWVLSAAALALIEHDARHVGLLRRGVRAADLQHRQH